MNEKCTITYLTSTGIQAVEIFRADLAAVEPMLKANDIFVVSVRNEDGYLIPGVKY